MVQLCLGEDGKLQAWDSTVNEAKKGGAIMSGPGDQRSVSAGFSETPIGNNQLTPKRNQTTTNPLIHSEKNGVNHVFAFGEWVSCCGTAMLRLIWQIAILR